MSRQGKDNRNEGARGQQKSDEINRSHDQLKQEANTALAQPCSPTRRGRGAYGARILNAKSGEKRSNEDDDDDDDDWMPALPPGRGSALRCDVEAENSAQPRHDLGAARRNERRVQRERLDELAPRAEPGTRERFVERRMEKRAADRAFREDKHGDDCDDGDDAFDGNGGGTDEYRRREAARARRKTEKELRRAARARARAEDVEKRTQAYRAREEKTMAMLKELARQRFE